MSHTIYKGLDKTVEFMGLGGQYLMLFFGGIVGIILVTLVLSVINTLVMLLFAVVSLLVLWCYVSYMNGKYGKYGVMQGQARRSCPRFLISRKSTKNML
jgi:membrane protein implicated in regulation of membrane protease activity